MSTCFVVMPIGNQFIEGKEVSYLELKEKYDDLIKEALLQAKPELEIIRADDVSTSGSISKDIFHRLIFSEYVIVDISYPNPNVFYELGLRHAVGSRTILLKEKNSKNVPFDILDLRYIEYENTPKGLKTLSDKLKKTFSNFDNETLIVDNEFLSYALSKGLKFQPIDFQSKKKELGEKALVEMLFSSPEMMLAAISGDEEELAKAISKFDNKKLLASAIVDSETHK
ncbi:hypothetical protein [Pectobacterium brasiliense]|uniref:hypothetical protein n=1 Tax=Pectobacterium brasiliense TaxID=180957 RepID=UPI000A899E48|nr:hypothetical protein [Pectobacterium brasiliense]